MTSLLATIAGQLLALVLRLASWFGESAMLLRFSNLMLLVAASTGVIGLLLTALALRWRDTPPPRAITQFAIAVSLLPIGTLVAVLIWGR